jgi:hypothetical protein
LKETVAMTQRLTNTLIVCAVGAFWGAATAAPDAPSFDTRSPAGALEIVPQSGGALPYDKLLIDDVEISYHPASPYGALEEKLEARIGAAAAEAIRAAVGEHLIIVAEPGTGVLRVRAAITNVNAERKARRFWSYTPFGLVKGRIDAATGRDFRLVSATVEVALYDAASGRQLAAVADVTGDDLGHVDGDLSFRTLVAKIGGWTRRLLGDLAPA